MKREIILICLAAGLLLGGTAASVALPHKERPYTAFPAEQSGEAPGATVMKKAALFDIPTEGRTLQEIAGSVKKEIKVKKESVRKYKSIIRSFSGAFVQYHP